MRLFGLRRHPLSEIRSYDAILSRSGASTTELLRLVNVGPFFKCLWHGYLPGKYAYRLTFCSSSYPDMISISEFYYEVYESEEICDKFPPIDDFGFPVYLLQN